MAATPEHTHRAHDHPSPTMAPPLSTPHSLSTSPATSPNFPSNSTQPQSPLLHPTMPVLSLPEPARGRGPLCVSCPSVCPPTMTNSTTQVQLLSSSSQAPSIARKSLPTLPTPSENSGGTSKPIFRNFLRSSASSSSAVSGVSDTPHPARVVVIGGGVAGLTVAAALDQKPKKYKVFLIDIKEYLEATAAVPPHLCGCSSAPPLETLHLPHSRTITNGQIIMGKVTSIQKTGVYIEQERSVGLLPYDYLVVCTGVYCPLFKCPPPSIHTRINAIKNEVEELACSESVIIAGGGVTGLEMAAWIAECFPKLQVTIIEKRKTIAHQLPPEVQTYITKFMVSKNVQLLCSVIVTSIVYQLEPQCGFIVTCESGQVFKCTRCYDCRSVVPNTQFFKAHEGVLDDEGYIRVNDKLQVQGFNKVFACGDAISSNTEKLASVAMIQAQSVIVNIKRSLRGQTLKTCIIGKKDIPPLVIGLGTQNGIAITNYSVVAVGEKAVQMRKLQDTTLKCLFPKQIHHGFCFSDNRIQKPSVLPPSSYILVQYPHLSPYAMRVVLFLAKKGVHLRIFEPPEFVEFTAAKLSDFSSTTSVVPYNPLAPGDLQQIFAGASILLCTPVLQESGISEDQMKYLIKVATSCRVHCVFPIQFCSGTHIFCNLQSKMEQTLKLESEFSYSIVHHELPFDNPMMDFTYLTVLFQKTVCMPMLEEGFRWIDTSDFVEAFAHILLLPPVHLRKEYWLLGSQSLSIAVITHTLSKTTGVTLRYLQISPEEAESRLNTLLPRYRLQCMLATRAKIYPAEGNDLEELIQRTTTTFSEWARKKYPTRLDSRVVKCHILEQNESPSVEAYKQIFPCDIKSLNQLGSEMTYKGVLHSRDIILKKFPVTEISVGAVKGLARMRAHFLHPCVVPLIGTCIYPDAIGFITPFEPHSLRSLLQDSSLDVKNNTKLQLAYDIASGLEFLHSFTFLHGNLKSENILVTAKMRAKIADASFEISPIIKTRSLNPAESGISLQSDVLAFGIVLWEIQTWKEFSKLRPVQDLESDFLSSLGTVEKAFSLAYLGLLKKCMEDDPEKRPHSSGVAIEIQNLMGTPPPKCTLADETPTMPPLPRRVTTLSTMHEELKMLEVLTWNNIGIDYWSSLDLTQLEYPQFQSASPSPLAWIPDLHFHYYRDYFVPAGSQHIFKSEDGDSPYLLCISEHSSDSVPVKSILFSKEGSRRLLLPPRTNHRSFQALDPSTRALNFVRCRSNLKQAAKIAEFENLLFPSTLWASVLDGEEGTGSSMRFHHFLQFLAGSTLSDTASEFQTAPFERTMIPPINFHIGNSTKKVLVVFSPNKQPDFTTYPNACVIFHISYASLSPKLKYRLNVICRPGTPQFPPIFEMPLIDENLEPSFHLLLLRKVANACRLDFFQTMKSGKQDLQDSLSSLCKSLKVASSKQVPVRADASFPVRARSRSGSILPTVGDNICLDLFPISQDQNADTSNNTVPEYFAPLIEAGKGYIVQEYIGPKRIADLSEGTINIADPLYFENWYREHFMGQSHSIFFGKFESDQSFLVSVIPTSRLEFMRVLLSTKATDYKGVIEIPRTTSSSVPIKQILKLVSPTTSPISINEVPSAKFGNWTKNLLKFYDSQISKCLKIGVIYCQPHQSQDQHFYSNKVGSAQFTQFLNLLGTQVPLEGFTGFAAGLDVKSNSTGTHSVYTEYRGFKLMFHVSTLLPWSEYDPQQVERKRHIGNDIVVILFYEGTPVFRPEIMLSQFNYIFIVVRCLDSGGYQCEIATKAGVPSFHPELQNPIIFKGDSLKYFRDFILCKAINGERVCYSSVEFASKLQVARRLMIENIINGL
ncbi:GTPaseactivating protein [Pelomyxa schiedti]|nr:GTPaseactivating protein [Pelomyxa schiedti]